MKLHVDQLQTFLEKTNPIPTVFLLSGDEPLQAIEASDAIRSAAKQQGYTEREILHADAQFNWSSLIEASNNLSLFSDKKILDLRLMTKTPGNAGSQVIRSYMQNPPDDKILLIQMPKLVGNARNSAWVKAIDKTGIVIQIWEKSPPETMAWVAKRLRNKGIQPTADAVRILTERVEGNLLAANQEINKLALLYHQKGEKMTPIDEEQILSSVSDSSRYSIFDLSNAVMLGDSHRVQHIHHNLREEGTPIPLILWTLSDLARQLYNTSFALRKGIPMQQLLAKLPRPKQRPFQIALQRMQHANWPEILEKYAELDRLSKGQGKIANKGLGRVWSDLLELALILSGKATLQNSYL